MFLQTGLNFKQGAQSHWGYLCQRSYSTMGEAEIDHLRVPAIFQFIVNGNRLSLVDLIFISFHFCTVVAIWNFVRSIMTVWAASERVDSSSKDVERLPSHRFSLLIIQPLLSGLIEVFLHVRCIPHQNSQRCFWASVCMCIYVCQLLEGSELNPSPHIPPQLLPTLRRPASAGTGRQTPSSSNRFRWARPRIGRENRI